MRSGKNQKNPCKCWIFQHLQGFFFGGEKEIRSLARSLFYKEFLTSDNILTTKREKITFFGRKIKAFLPWMRTADRRLP